MKCLNGDKEERKAVQIPCREKREFSDPVSGRDSAACDRMAGRRKKEESKYGFWDSQHDTIVSEGSEDASIPEMTADAKAMREYATVMEGQLEDFLSSVEGAGDVKVFLTLKGSGEAVIEKDTESSLDSSTEVEGSSSRNAAESTEKMVSVYTEDGTRPFIKKVIYPEVEGVVVCVSGADQGKINKNITEAIQALFGIDVHKIKIIKMSSR